MLLILNKVATYCHRPWSNQMEENDPVFRNGGKSDKPRLVLNHDSICANIKVNKLEYENKTSDTIRKKTPHPH